MLESYRLGWDFCILAVIGRWLLCSGGCLLRLHLYSMLFTVIIYVELYSQVDYEDIYMAPSQNIGSLYEQLHQTILSRSSISLVLTPCMDS